MTTMKIKGMIACIAMMTIPVLAQEPKTFSRSSCVVRADFLVKTEDGVTSTIPRELNMRRISWIRTDTPGDMLMITADGEDLAIQVTDKKQFIKMFKECA